MRKKIIHIFLILLLLSSSICGFSNEAQANHPDNYEIMSFNQTLTVSKNYTGVTDFSSGPTTNLIIRPHSIEYKGGDFVKSPLQPMKFKYPNGRIELNTSYIPYEGVTMNIGTVSSVSNATMPDVLIAAEPMSTRHLFVLATTDRTDSYGTIYASAGSINVVTPPANSIIYVENIEQTSVRLRVDSRGNFAGSSWLNGYGYGGIQRSQDGINWVEVHNLENGVIFTDQGLQAGKTYYYRTWYRHQRYGGSFSNTQFNYQGGNFYITVKTTDDPVMIAAQKAQNAAEAAEAAAQDSKVASQGAQNKAQQVYDLVSSLELANVKNDISYMKQTLSTPVIQSVTGQNNATATFANHFIVKISAAGPQENLRYRVVCDGFDSGWDTSYTINITGISSPGVKTAKIYVSNYSEDPDKGSIASKEFVFFKL